MEHLKWTCVSVRMSVLTLIFIICHVWWVGRINNKQETGLRCVHYEHL